jgi:hypothetical protein
LFCFGDTGKQEKRTAIFTAGKKPEAISSLIKRVVEGESDGGEKPVNNIATIRTRVTRAFSNSNDVHKRNIGRSQLEGNKTRPSDYPLQ